MKYSLRGRVDEGEEQQYLIELSKINNSSKRLYKFKIIGEKMSYAELIDEILSLPTDEKKDLKNLLDKYLIEERRNEILKNHLDAIEMVKKGDLKFSSDTDELMQMLELK